MELLPPAKTVVFPIWFVCLWTRLLKKSWTNCHEVGGWMRVGQTTDRTFLVGMCRIRISVRFLKTSTELNRSLKVKSEISVSVAFLKTGPKQNRTWKIHYAHPQFLDFKQDFSLNCRWMFVKLLGVAANVAYLLPFTPACFAGLT